MNSNNEFDTFLPDECEKPRLSVLKNFKSINRVMRSTFLKKPYEIQDDDLPSYHKVKALGSKMTRIMKHLGSPSKLQPLPGEPAPVPIPQTRSSSSLMPLGNLRKLISESGEYGVNDLRYEKLDIRTLQKQKDNIFEVQDIDNSNPFFESEFEERVFKQAWDHKKSKFETLVHEVVEHKRAIKHHK